MKQSVSLPAMRRKPTFLLVMQLGSSGWWKCNITSRWDDLMTWANAARRAQLGLMMIAAEPWDRDVDMADGYECGVVYGFVG